MICTKTVFNFYTIDFCNIVIVSLSRIIWGRTGEHHGDDYAVAIAAVTQLGAQWSLCFRCRAKVVSSLFHFSIFRYLVTPMFDFSVVHSLGYPITSYYCC